MGRVRAVKAENGLKSKLAKEENTANKMSSTLIEQAGELTDLTYAIRRALTVAVKLSNVRAAEAPMSPAGTGR